MRPSSPLQSFVIIAFAALGCRAAPAGDLPRPGSDGRWNAEQLAHFDAEKTLAARGDALMITSLWASWCGPCVREMPELGAFQEAHPEVAVLGLATASATHQIQDILDRVRPTYAQALLDGGEGPFLERFGIEWDGTLPKTILIDRQGTAHKLDNPVTRDSLEAALAAYPDR